MKLPTTLSLFLVIAAGTPQLLLRAQKPQTPDATSDEIDFYQPADLQELVDTSDAIVVAQVIRPLEPRKQETMLETGQVTDFFAQYVIKIHQVVKSHHSLRNSGPQVIEQMVSGQTLEDFRQGRPSIGQGELLLFLHHYPHAGTFQIGSWKWQFLRTPSGTPKPVSGEPMVEFVGEHPLLNANVQARTAGDWDAFLEEIRTLARSNGKE